MTFKKAVQNANTESNVAFTDNGAITNKSSLNDVLDLFAIIGSLRSQDLSTYVDTFEKSYAMNRKLTLQMLLWLRDVRGGAGERNTARTLLLHLEATRPSDVLEILPVLAEYGRWDDLLIFQTDAIQQAAYALIADALNSGNALCAKWMPRIYKMKKGDNHDIANQNRRNNNNIARNIMKVMGLDERKYRKLLSSLSSTVETQMCAKKWDEISYESVPSVAMTRYTDAFKKNDAERFTEYSEALVNGTAKVNAAALFPYDITTRIASTEDQIALNVLNAQWDALPNYIKPGSKIIPMCDTSSSMTNSSIHSSLTPMKVAMALSLYVSDKQDGDFKNLFLTFDSDPMLIELEGQTVSEKYDDLQQYRGGEYWGGSTDIGKAFELILDVAVRNSVQPSDMPDTLMIFSDMQFNTADWRGVERNNGAWDVTAYEYATKLFEQHGYSLPKVVFWNLDGRPGNNPVTVHDTGTAMVSGFSPAVLGSILGDKEFNPIQIMMETIDVPRYQVLK